MAGMTNSQWAAQVLQYGGWPVTQNNVTSILQWMASEEPPTNWWDRNNPLNNGLGSGGGAGLGSYPSLTVAAQYAAQNISSGNYGYSSIASSLARSATPQTTAQAIQASDWASSHYGYGANWHTSAVPNVAAGTGAVTGTGATATLLQKSKTGKTLTKYYGKFPPTHTKTGRVGLTSTGHVGKTQILVTPSTIPGVSATAPSAPSFGNTPFGDFSTSMKWLGEFGMWGFFTLIVLGFGITLMALGGVLLVLVLIPDSAKSGVRTAANATGAGRAVNIVSSLKSSGGSTPTADLNAQSRSTEAQARNVRAHESLTTARARTQQRESDDAIEREFSEQARYRAPRDRQPQLHRRQRSRSVGRRTVRV